MLACHVGRPLPRVHILQLRWASSSSSARAAWRLLDQLQPCSAASQGRLPIITAP